MNFKQYLKNKKNVIEKYLESPDDPLMCYNLIKERKYSYFNEQKDYLCSKIIRKNLQLTNDQLYKMPQSNNLNKNYTKGLYHDRDNDIYDKDHIYCIEDGFCMKHERINQDSAYKYHYHCKYGMCTHSYKDTNMFHGEKKWFSNKFVCFNCRKYIKQSYKQFNYSINWPKCTECQKHMTCVSIAFQPPPKDNIKKWKKIDNEWYNDSRITYEEYMKLF